MSPGEAGAPRIRRVQRAGGGGKGADEPAGAALAWVRPKGRGSAAALLWPQRGGPTRGRVAGGFKLDALTIFGRVLPDGEAKRVLSLNFDPNMPGSEIPQQLVVQRNRDRYCAIRYFSLHYYMASTSSHFSKSMFFKNLTDF